MQKDVIYIDVEDDITAIIGKVKDAKHKIVALVPPKRIGVLQSAVNLRLLARAATQSDRRLVLISNNKALASLAATAKIPVAKNLQSKPEIAEIAALDIDDGNDVIDGAELPVGDHAKQAGISMNEVDDAVVAAAGAAAVDGLEKATPPSDGKSVQPKVKRGVKVPNFNIFRKKLVLIIIGVVLLIGLLVWALAFAPRAKVIVSMQTTDSAVSQLVNLSISAETSADNNIIKAVTRQHTDDVEVDVVATGEKNVGEKATAVVKLSRLSPESTTVPAGTELESQSGLIFVTDSTATIPASEPCFPTFCAQSTTVGVTAAERGAKYNGASGELDGGPSGMNAEFQDASTGGTDKTATVFTSGDIEKAETAADKAIDEDAARTALKDQFGDDFIVIDSSLQVSKSGLKTDAKVDAEGSKTTYGGPVTYTMYAVAKSELDDYLTAVLEQQIDNTDDQRVYDTGASDVQFTNVDKSDEGLRATLSTNGKIGPKITEDQVKELAAGQRYNDIRSRVEAINGVNSVEIEMSPFWVSQAPNNVNKIMVEFKLNES